MGNRQVYVKDIAEVVTDKSILYKVNNIKLLNISEKKETHFLISVIDVIRAIDNAFPNSTITNVGEIDTVVEFSPEKRPDNPMWKWTKVIFIAIVLSMGAATTIMSFHTDAALPVVFQNLYYIFFNEKVTSPVIIEIPYSIGIAAGILFFYNHLGNKKITNDPTPIEVEMSLYEKDVTDTMIDILNVEKSKTSESHKQ